MSVEKNHSRAVRYRKLALQEPDRQKAELLNRIAEDADRGVLCTVDQMHAVTISSNPLSSVGATSLNSVLR